MKSQISFVLLSFFFSNFVFADCNYKVAESASQYLNELEKANLQKYQNSSVCEVLTNETERCSKEQIAELNNKANLKKTLGDYCEAYRKTAKAEASKNKWSKGAELLSWQDRNGIYWFALLPGTNRLKNTDEIVSNKVSSGNVRDELAKLPPKTHVVWNNVVKDEARKKLDFTFPPESVATGIRQEAQRAQLDLEMR